MAIIAENDWGDSKYLVVVLGTGKRGTNYVYIPRFPDEKSIHPGYKLTGVTLQLPA